MTDQLTERLRRLPPADLPNPPDRHLAVLRRARARRRLRRATAGVGLLAAAAGGSAAAVLLTAVPGAAPARLPAGARALAPSPPVSSPSAASGAVPRACAFAALSVSLGVAQGSAGTFFYPLVFTNSGSVACTLTGYPGVSFTDAKGVQVGQSAQERNAFGSEVYPLLLAPGASATSTIGVVDPGNVPPASCQPRATAQIRVYPPNTTRSLLLAQRVTLCSVGPDRPFVTPVAGASGSS